MDLIPTLHDRPLHQRPRERLAAHGPDALSLVELIVLVLGRGNGKQPVWTITETILSRYPTLQELAAAALADLCVIPGVGLAKASQLIACFELARRWEGEWQGTALPLLTEPALSASQLSRLVRAKIPHPAKEHLVVASFDVRSKLLGLDIVSVGTLTASLVHPRETFEAAIRRHAVNVIIAHNHPSGDPEPSEHDIDITTRLAVCGRMLGIEVLDHLIITDQLFISMREYGLME